MFHPTQPISLFHVLPQQDSVAEGGVIREYMQLAELTCLLGPTLFVHGQLIGNFHHGALACC